jgi:hypothetical protein
MAVSLSQYDIEFEKHLMDSVNLTPLISEVKGKENFVLKDISKRKDLGAPDTLVLYNLAVQSVGPAGDGKKGNEDGKEVASGIRNMHTQWQCSRELMGLPSLRASAVC